MGCQVCDVNLDAYLDDLIYANLDEMLRFMCVNLDVCMMMCESSCVYLVV